MFAAPSPAAPRLRPFLVLGRVSNLPTVWSNCLAAWLISDGGRIGRLIAAVIGTSLLYLGGMYLNDWFDAEADRAQRPSRPIPSGRVSANLVWALGWGWVSLGVLTLVFAGAGHWLVLFLVAAIVVYNAVHKATTLAPLLLGCCRLLVYLVAGSVADGGVAGFAIWCGLAQGSYVVGLSYIARQETRRTPIAWWPLMLMLVPVLLALIANVGPYREMAIALSLLLVVWVLVVVGPALGDSPANTPLIVQKLLAGIVAVDLLATGGEPRGSIACFLVFFALTLIAHRFVPGS